MHLALAKALTFFSTSLIKSHFFRTHPSSSLSSQLKLVDCSSFPLDPRLFTSKFSLPPASRSMSPSCPLPCLSHSLSYVLSSSLRGGSILLLDPDAFRSRWMTVSSPFPLLHPPPNRSSWLKSWPAGFAKILHLHTCSTDYVLELTSHLGPLS